MSDTNETAAPIESVAPVNPAPVVEAESKTAEVKGKEAPKAPPSTKDWAAITQAEKKAHAIALKAKEEAKKLQADRAAFEAEKTNKVAGLEALKEAYKTGNYDQIEKEFPDLYKKLTQSKLKAGNKPQVPTEESILAKIEAKQKAEEKVRQEKATQERWGAIENNFVRTIEGNKDKYPLLMIECEDDPELIREKLREIDSKTETKTFEAAADELESWLKAKAERRYKALGITKIEPQNSPKETSGQKSKDATTGPTTLTQRMVQENSLNPNQNMAVDDDIKSPVYKAKKRIEEEKAMMAKAIEDFKSATSRSKQTDV